MAVQLNNFYNNKAIEVLEGMGCMTIIQYKQDLSVMPNEAQTKYFMSKMGCASKQLVNKRVPIILLANIMKLLNNCIPISRIVLNYTRL